ncbi:NUDIX domain-containing protein [bacterium]|nr:MAG: NUDIX domain-containing protein [bacterium]
MPSAHQTFHIGINVFVIKDSQLLLGKRKGACGAGTWGLPGGHLETGEAMEGAGIRELLEETGLKAKNLAFSNIVNSKSREKHYIQIGFVAQDFEGEPAVKEPDRCEEWKWFKLESLPQPIFPPHEKQIENYLNRSAFVEA